MSLVMYERVGHEGRRPSPFSRRIRYALAHKGAQVEFRLVRFADVESVEWSAHGADPLRRRPGDPRLLEHRLLP
jgi:glutathione S-transferase